MREHCSAWTMRCINDSSITFNILFHTVWKPSFHPGYFTSLVCFCISPVSKWDAKLTCNVLVLPCTGDKNLRPQAKSSISRNYVTQKTDNRERQKDWSIGGKHLRIFNTNFLRVLLSQISDNQITVSSWCSALQCCIQLGTVQTIQPRDF